MFNKWFVWSEKKNSDFFVFLIWNNNQVSLEIRVLYFFANMHLILVNVLAIDKRFVLMNAVELNLIEFWQALCFHQKFASIIENQNCSGLTPKLFLYSICSNWWPVFLVQCSSSSCKDRRTLPGTLKTSEKFRVWENNSRAFSDHSTAVSIWKTLKLIKPFKAFKKLHMYCFSVKRFGLFLIHLQSKKATLGNVSNSKR